MMKWKPKYKYGDYRVAGRFLWLPMRDFLGQGEVRWWVWARFVQKFLGYALGVFPLWSLPYKWADNLPEGDITFDQYEALK